MKMNGRFKAAFILLIACLVCAIAAGAAGFIWKSNAVAMAAGAAGMVCAFTGIMLAMRSGKKPEPDPLPPDEND